MKIVIISDTHGQHRKLGRLQGDVLIHCGDFENIFEPENQDLQSVDDWFAEQRFDHILCVGGNHDHDLENRVQQNLQPFQNATFLHDQTIEIGGLKFHGSSWVPQLRQHSFYGAPKTLKRAWAAIPQDTDVLITHTPPAGILDVSSRGLKLGCRYLAARIDELNLKLHFFGHVHASAGAVTKGSMQYVNASSVESDFTIAHTPHVVELSKV